MFVLGSGVPYMVRLRPPGLGVKGGPQRRVPIATGPPPGYAASAGARSELAMWTVHVACQLSFSMVPAPQVPRRHLGCRPQVPRRHLRCRPQVPRRGTSGAAAAPQTCAAARRGDCYRDTLEEIATEIRSRYARDVNLHRISPRRGTRARHLRCRPGSRARHLGCTVR